MKFNTDSPFFEEYFVLTSSLLEHLSRLQIIYSDDKFSFALHYGALLDDLIFNLPNLDKFMSEKDISILAEKTSALVAKRFPTETPDQEKKN